MVIIVFVLVLNMNMKQVFEEFLSAMDVPNEGSLFYNINNECYGLKPYISWLIHLSFSRSIN